MPEWAKLSMDESISPYQLWLNQALDDLSWTKANLKERVWYGACFTAQQSAEKALKAYLIYQGKDVKKVHDLGALLQECINIESEFETLRENCATLTDYYAPARYPDIGEFMDFNEENAKEAYGFAEKIVSFIEKKLSAK